MWDFSIGRTLGLHGPDTALHRCSGSSSISASRLPMSLVTGVGAGVGWGVGAFGDEDFRAGSIVWGGVIGFGLTAGTICFLREYLLYIVKAGHIAVLVELLDGRGVPQGQGQITYATDIVRAAFRRDQCAVRRRPAGPGVLGGDPRADPGHRDVSCRSRGCRMSWRWCAPSCASPSG